jgi:hypothetical protein
MISIGFDSDEIILKKLRERLRRMSDEELIKFGKDGRRLAENPFQRQLEEARAEEAEKRSGRFEQVNQLTYDVTAFPLFSNPHCGTC